MPDKNFHPNNIAMILAVNNFNFRREFIFHTVRKFRFDFALPQYKIAIEFEGGLTMIGAGHNSIGGFFKDCNKYNLAVIDGWKILRYTTKHFSKASDYQQVINDINAIIKPKRI